MRHARSSSPWIEGVRPQRPPRTRPRSARCFEASTADIAVCDVRGVEPDAVTVDALAGLLRSPRAVTAARHPAERLGGAPQFVDFMGLEDVVARLEAVGQAEQREDALGVEEERDAFDAIAPASISTTSTTTGGASAGLAAGLYDARTRARRCAVGASRPLAAGPGRQAPGADVLTGPRATGQV